MVALSKFLIATLVGFFSHLIDMDSSADIQVQDKNLQKMEHLSMLTFTTARFSASRNKTGCS